MCTAYYNNALDNEDQDGDDDDEEEEEEHDEGDDDEDDDDSDLPWVQSPQIWTMYICLLPDIFDQKLYHLKIKFLLLDVQCQCPISEKYILGETVSVFFIFVLNISLRGFSNIRPKK